MDFRIEMLISFMLVMSLFSSDLAADPIRNSGSSEEEVTTKPNKLSKNFTTNCISMRKGQKLQIKGTSFRLSDVDLETCSDIGSSHAVQFIEIFASKRVVIDKDLNFIGKAMHVAIFAPELAVIGKRTINLNGINGKPHKEISAKNGVERGYINGAHGLAGMPGSPAGHFYGLAKKIERAEDLTILANGGNGGPGQNGGEGANGRPGETFQNHPLFDCSNIKKGIPNLPGWIVKSNGEHIRYTRFGLPVRITRYFKVIGRPGGIPGRGGNGGAAGLGGKGGEIIIEVFLEHKHEPYSVIVSSVDGKIGDVGLHGLPGDKGKSGRDRDIDCERGEGVHTVSITKEHVEALNISRGEDGTRLKIRQLPNNSKILQNYPSTLNAYKRFVRSEMFRFKYDLPLEAFYNELNNCWRVNNKYDTMTFAEEFMGLEQDYFYFHKQLNLTKSYEDFANRLVYYAEGHHEKDERTEGYKTILNDLHLEVTTKLTTSDVNKTSIYPVRTNMKSAFKSLVLEPSQAMEKSERIVSITRWFEKNIRPMEEQIEEAQYMINVIIKNAMNDVETSLNQEMNALLEEITTLKEENDFRTAELIVSREQLKNVMILKKIFGAMKSGLMVAEIVYPAAGVTTQFASSAVSLIEKSVIDTDSETIAKEMPKAVKSAIEVIDKLFKQKKEKEDKVIGEQKKFVDAMKDKIASYATDVISEVWNTTSAIRNSEEKSVEAKGTAMEDVYNQKENEIMKNYEDAVNKKDKERIKKYEAGLKVVKYLKATSQVFESGSEILIQHMKDNAKIDGISNEIQKSLENGERLDKLRDQIYNTADSMLQNLIGSLSGDSVKDMNENNLMLNKWNVTENLKEMQRLMKKMTNGLNVSEDMQWTFDKLLTNFNIMTSMTNQILKYKRERDERFFNTGLHISDMRLLKVTDAKLRNALAESKMLISYNTMSESYDKWIFAFKQFAFPTAVLVLENFERPDTFRDESIEAVIQGIKTNIVNFKNKLYDESHSDDHLANRKNQTFSGSTTIGKNALYIWKKEIYAKKIEKILTGENTVLEAKIDSQKSLNALKFNKLKLLFTSTDYGIQQNIYRNLYDFGVKIIHHGDSKYKCNENIYEIITTHTEMEFSFVNDTTDGRWHSTAIHSKIENGDFVLSPYATWSIKLTTNDRQNFDTLRQYIGKVNLELIGQGQIFENSNQDCPSSIDKFYTKIL